MRKELTANQNNIKTIEYYNWSTQIFDGFYESWLWNSDSVLYMTEYEPEPPAGYCYDIHGFDEYCNEVGEYAVRLLDSEVTAFDRDIVLSMKFKGISSPMYYNFSTDKLIIDVEVDYDKLKDYCLKKDRTGFDEYLHENFTSYDGFISFVDNNVNDFELNLESESEKYDQVMLEYYLLGFEYIQEREHDFSEYKSELYEYANEKRWNRLCLEKDGKYYGYTLSDDGNECVVGDEISESVMNNRIVR